MQYSIIKRPLITSDEPVEFLKALISKLKARKNLRLNEFELMFIKATTDSYQVPIGGTY